MLISGRQSGKTLLELLVVTVLIAILMLFAISGAGHLRMKGKMVRSTTNLRTMSAALFQYESDHGHLPESGVTCFFKGKKIHFWFNAIGPYVEGDDYLDKWEHRAERPEWQQCPGRPFKQFALRWGKGYTVGYGWNYQQFGYAASSSPSDKYEEKFGYAVRLSAVTHPAQTIIIGTNREYYDDGSPIPFDGGGGDTNVLLYANKPKSVRFNGLGLYLMLDGRVQPLTPEQALANSGYLFKRQK